jgi:hypothetical protein
MKKIITIIIVSFLSPIGIIFGQGLNHTWLIGYADFNDTFNISQKARMLFDTASYSLIPETRKIPFEETEGNISDENGNLLMSSNGVWIANATGDTMLNGGGLNPSPFTSYHSIYGLPLPYGNLFLPWPGDSIKYVLFHETSNDNINFITTDLFYSIIDITHDGGLGEVIQKNQIAFQDTSLSWGLGACKHANGRDWWIIALKDWSNIIYKVLLTPSGIASVSTQILNVPYAYSNATQPTFSPDGTKFAYAYGLGGANPYHDIRLFHFDRCTGILSDTTFIPITNDIATGTALAFSPNSKYLYFSSFQTIYQINTDTTDIPASLNIVAINDVFYSPLPPLSTNFMAMYLAANGKIYITSGNSVQDLHYINSPDSGGIACDVQLHALHLPCWIKRSVPNHPNYYLGPIIGSVCDSIPPVGINEQSTHDFHFAVSPNPVTDDYLKIVYLLPQNKAGVFEVFDMTGRKVFIIPLPSWSTLQQITLPKLAEGIYSAVITSGGKRISRKIAIIGE